MRYKLCEVVDFNPTERLPKGTVAKKVAMDKVQTFSRDIHGYTQEPYNGGAKFRNGDTIMARITPCLENGKSAYISFLDKNEVGYGSTEFIVWRAKEGVTDREYVYYLSQSPDIRDVAVKSMVGSSGRQRVQQGVLDNYEIDLPPLETQRAIAATLSALDAKIAVNNKLNHNLEQTARAIFKSWFVGLEPSKPFTDVVQILGGGTPKIDVAEYWNGDIPFFTPKDTSVLYTLETEKSLTAAGLSKCNSRLYPTNTVFVTARGTVGKLALAGCPMAMNQSCYALLGKEGYGQFFVYHLALETVANLKNKASGAVFDAIVTRDFEGEFVPVPSLESVIAFEEKVSPFYATILTNMEDSIRLAKLRDSLLPRLISGELSIADG